MALYSSEASEVYKRRVPNEVDKSLQGRCETLEQQLYDVSDDLLATQAGFEEEKEWNRRLRADVMYLREQLVGNKKAVPYIHLRAHETPAQLVCRHLL